MKTIIVIATIGLALFASATERQFDLPPSEKMNFISVFETKDIPVIVYPPKDPAKHDFPDVPFLPTCRKQGYIRDPFNCAKFYRCNEPDAVPYALYCPPGLIFDVVENWCNFPNIVEC